MSLVCACVCPAGSGRWMVEPGGGSRRRSRGGGGAASLLILYLSRLSTESSAVPPSSLKPKYYYLCPLSIITPPLSIMALCSPALIIIICLRLRRITTPHSHELRNDPVAFMTNMILTQNICGYICLIVSTFTLSKAQLELLRNIF